jgi:transcriptional regulator with XRE-family HTH domain
MRDVNDLLDRAKRRAGLTSDNQLAGQVGVSRASVSGWRHGKNLPDEVAAAKLADMAGEPLAHVLGVIGEARAISREAKAVWRRLASAAALLAAGVLLSLPEPAHAAGVGHSSPYVLDIMRTGRRSRRRVKKPRFRPGFLPMASVA